MSDDTGGSSKRSAAASGLVSLFIPHPSVDIIKFWQGIVEIATRGASLIVMLIVFIAASVAQDETINVTDANAVTTARAAAGWVIFVGVIAFIYESLFIVIRFLNFTFMTTYRQICLIIDIIFSGTIALFIFAGAVSMAVGAEYARQFINGGQFDNFLIRIANSLGAAAFFAFVAMFVFIFLAVWMVLYIVLKWDIKGGSGGSSSAEKSVD